MIQAFTFAESIARDGNGCRAGSMMQEVFA